MKKLGVISASLILVSTFVLVPLVHGDPGIEVDPIYFNFGDVELGSASTTIITITNYDNVFFYIIDNVSFSDRSDPDFTITANPTGNELGPGQSADVHIRYTPSDLGAATATLVIEWTDGGTGTEYVDLSGTGVGAHPPPPSIDDILSFFDDSSGDGTLVGSGPGASAEGRMNAMRNMLEAAGEFLDGGYILEACNQLLDAYEHCDGLPKPPDFVEGSAAPTLAGMILHLMAGQGCE